MRKILIMVFAVGMIGLITACTPAVEEVLANVCSADMSNAFGNGFRFLDLEEGSPEDLHPILGLADTVAGGGLTAARVAFATSNTDFTNLDLDNVIPQQVQNRTNADFVLIDLFIPGNNGPKRVILGMVSNELEDGIQTVASFIGNEIGGTDAYTFYRSMTNNVDCSAFQVS